MKKFTIIASLLVTLASASAAHATQFVQNGDFTSLTNGLGLIGNGGHTKATDWTTTGYNLVTNDGSLYPNKGMSLWTGSNGGANTWNGTAPNSADNFLAMDGDYGTSPVTQTITGLTVGQNYTLSFDYAFSQQKNYSGATIQSLSADLGGSQVFNSASFDVASHGFSGWQSYSETITATSSSEVLSFLAKGNLPVPPFALLTNVSLTSGVGAVPEPATWAMMLVGMGMIGAVARRRQDVSVSYA